MRLGINTFLFTSPFNNESTKLFPQFKKWGFETVEIAIEDPSHIDPQHVKAELDKNKLACGSVLRLPRAGPGFARNARAAADWHGVHAEDHRPDGRARVPKPDRPGLLLRGPRGRRAARRIQAAVEDGRPQS